MNPKDFSKDEDDEEDGDLEDEDELDDLEDKKFIESLKEKVTSKDSEGKIILKEEVPETSSGIEDAKGLIEKRLGYSFKLEELPPNLRARLVKLENARSNLEEKVMRYYDEVVKGRQQRISMETNIRTKIEDINRQLENPTAVKPANVGWAVGCGTFLLLISVLFIFAPYSDRYAAAISFLILGALFLVPSIYSYLHVYLKKDEYKRKLLEEKSKALKSLDEYKKSEKEQEQKQETALKPYKNEIISLIRNFNKDLASLSNDIDTSLSVIFQGKMDFGLIRSTMKAKGLVIEKIECPYCGGPITLPKTGHVVKCPHCGNDVYAADVLKELEKR